MTTSNHSPREHGKSLQIGGFMETVGIEPTKGSRREPRRAPGQKPLECRDKAARRRANVPGHGTEGVTSMQDQAIRIPLRNRVREIVAHAIVDPADAYLAEHRWYLDVGGPTRSGKPYARRTVRGHGALYLHRCVLGLPQGDPRKGDHVNGDTLDNRRANLRIVTDAQNAQNQGSRGGSSRHRGVAWDKSRGRWMASATLNGKRTTIGRFATEDEAAKAAAEWRAEHMPFSGETA